MGPSARGHVRRHSATGHLSSIGLGPPRTGSRKVPSFCQSPRAAPLRVGYDSHTRQDDPHQTEDDHKGPKNKANRRLSIARRLS